MHRLVLLLLMALGILAVGLYAYAEQACPVPSWAFWTEDYDTPRFNFSFAECD